MQILHLYKDYFPVLGGIENHIKMLAEAQAARGHNVAVLVTSREHHTHVEMVNGVRVIFAARMATISSAPLSAAFCGLLARERPDVIHMHFPYPWGEAAYYVFGHARKTVLTYHSDIVRQRYLRVLYAPLMERVLNCVDAIVATSPNYIATSHELARWQRKCSVVPLGIDPVPYIAASPLSPRSQKGEGQGAAWRGVEGVGGGTLLFVGRLRYYKGLGYLLRAMLDLPDARLFVAGTGPMELEWRNLARDLKINERVNFLGEVADSDLPALYMGCDLFVLPCSERSEAFGVVQLEAMAAGKPVVSCDVGTGVAWVNQNEVTGLIVPPSDPGALASAINRILRDKKLGESMGISGRKRVLSEFTAEAMVERVMGVYERVLA